MFDSKGRVRLRAGYQWHWSKWLGLEAGIGVTSPIADQSVSVRAEPRAHLGAHLQTVYADRAIGELFVGYARDKSWERLVDLDGNPDTTEDRQAQQRFDRVLLEGTILFRGSSSATLAGCAHQRRHTVERRLAERAACEHPVLLPVHEVAGQVPTNGESR